MFWSILSANSFKICSSNFPSYITSTGVISRISNHSSVSSQEKHNSLFQTENPKKYEGSSLYSIECLAKRFSPQILIPSGIIHYKL